MKWKTMNFKRLSGLAHPVEEGPLIDLCKAQNRLRRVLNFPLRMGTVLLVLLSIGRVASGAFDRAEAASNCAAGSKEVTSQASEDCAQIRIAGNDRDGATPYLNEALHANASLQNLWFLEGEAARDLGNEMLAIHCLKQGLGLGGVHIPEVSSLLLLYLA